MFKYSEITEKLSFLGIKVEEFTIKDMEYIEPYYLIYTKERTNYVNADGKNFFGLVLVKAILDVDDLESDVIKKLDEFLTEEGVPFDKSYEYIPDDRLFELSYEFEVYDG